MYEMIKHIAYTIKQHKTQKVFLNPLAQGFLNVIPYLLTEIKIFSVDYSN